MSDELSVSQSSQSRYFVETLTTTHSKGLSHIERFGICEESASTAASDTSGVTDGNDGTQKTGTVSSKGLWIRKWSVHDPPVAVAGEVHD